MLKALGSNIILRRIESALEAQGKRAGIVIASDTKRDGMKTVFVKGEVVSVGPKYSKDTATFLKSGDIVLYNPFDEDDWDGLKIVNGAAIVAKVE
jgi:co-chaperonin GroES (HSP10)